MYLTHITIPMPRAGEHSAREFYGKILGLREITKPQVPRAPSEVWFDVGGLELCVTVDECRLGVEGRQHFGLGCGDLNGLKARIEAFGMEIEAAREEAQRGFFVRDPFGNRIEIHAPRGQQAQG